MIGDLKSPSVLLSMVVMLQNLTKTADCQNYYLENDGDAYSLRLGISIMHGETFKLICLDVDSHSPTMTRDCRIQLVSRFPLSSVLLLTLCSSFFKKKFYEKHEAKIK